MKKNRYYYKDDKEFVSVTTVLDIINKGEWFLNWLKSNKQEDIKKTSEDATTFGIRMHNIFERIGKGETIDLEGLDKRTLRCLDAFLKWKEKHKVIFLQTEHIVYNIQDCYAGTLDGKVEMIDDEGNSITALLDYKTSKNIYDDYDLQVAAYAKADELMTGDIVDRAYILRFEKNPDKKQSLEIHEVKDINKAYYHFKCALELWRWRNEKKTRKK